MEFLLLLGFLLLSLLVIGAVCGIIAIVRVQSFERRLKRLEAQLSLLQTETPVSSPEPVPLSVKAKSESPAMVEKVKAPIPGPRPASVDREETPPPSFETSEKPVRPRPTPQPMPGKRHGPGKPDALCDLAGLEMVVGTKWLNWVGIVLLIVSVAFFLKYAYDNAWVGPRGRMLMGVVAGLAALVAGEVIRRVGYPILFRVLTGGGVGILYLCTYFSYQVYHFIEPTPAFTVSVFLTLFAVAVGVFRNAKSICIFGQLGGFLSPVLLSSGTGQALHLFCYIFVLNLIMVWSAYFRKWPQVNIVGFLGTALIYGLWLFQAYTPDQLGLALFFSTIFYLTFLSTPLLRSAIERSEADRYSLTLIVAATALAFSNYAVLLYEGYPTALALVVVVQAVLVFGLRQIRDRLCPEDLRTIQVLQMTALTLVTVAIPIRLRFYALAIVWSFEAVLLSYVGVKYESRGTLAFGHGTLLLAAASLLLRLPIHVSEFIPLFNTGFGSWALGIAAAVAVYRFQSRKSVATLFFLPEQRALPAVVAVSLTCVLLHFEVTRYWLCQTETLGAGIAALWANTGALILWSAIACVSVETVRRRGFPLWTPVAGVPFIIGLLLAFPPLFSDWPVSSMPFANLYFLSKALFSAALLRGAWCFRRSPWVEGATVAGFLEACAHLIPILYIPSEVSRGLQSVSGLSAMHQHGIVSGLWSFYALVLIVVGLKTRLQLRRILGMLLFGITVLKILALDMSQLPPVYRIVSLFASGALLIVAGYVYQKFAKTLLIEEEGIPPRDAAERSMPSVADEVEHTHVADLVQDVFTVVEAREALKKIIEIHEGDEELSELVDECRAVSNSSNNLNVLELCRRIAEMD